MQSVRSHYTEVGPAIRGSNFYEGASISFLNAQHSSVHNSIPDYRISYRCCLEIDTGQSHRALKAVRGGGVVVTIVEGAVPSRFEPHCDLRWLHTGEARALPRSLGGQGCG